MRETKPPVWVSGTLLQGQGVCRLYEERRGRPEDEMRRLFRLTEDGEPEPAT